METSKPICTNDADATADSIDQNKVDTTSLGETINSADLSKPGDVSKTPLGVNPAADGVSTTTTATTPKETTGTSTTPNNEPSTTPSTQSSSSTSDANVASNLKKISSTIETTPTNNCELSSTSSTNAAASDSLNSKSVSSDNQATSNTVESSNTAKPDASAVMIDTTLSKNTISSTITNDPTKAANTQMSNAESATSAEATVDTIAKKADSSTTPPTTATTTTATTTTDSTLNNTTTSTNEGSANTTTAVATNTTPATNTTTNTTTAASTVTPSTISAPAIVLAPAVLDRTVLCPWKGYTHAPTQKKYFHNAILKKSVWEKPKMMDEMEEWLKANKTVTHTITPIFSMSKAAAKGNKAEGMSGQLSDEDDDDNDDDHYVQPTQLNKGITSETLWKTMRQSSIDNKWYPAFDSRVVHFNLPATGLWSALVSDPTDQTKLSPIGVTSRELDDVVRLCGYDGLWYDAQHPQVQCQCNATLLWFSKFEGQVDAHNDWFSFENERKGALVAQNSENDDDDDDESFLPSTQSLPRVHDLANALASVDAAIGLTEKSGSTAVSFSPIKTVTTSTYKRPGSVDVGRYTSKRSRTVVSKYKGDASTSINSATLNRVTKIIISVLDEADHRWLSHDEVCEGVTEVRLREPEPACVAFGEHLRYVPTTDPRMQDKIKNALKKLCRPLTTADGDPPRVEKEKRHLMYYYRRAIT
eukprot:m.135719 g.135719  ORF g.135719 m.135719 type:complete len:703 (+) comp29814_c2_seq3:71-2179(+)